MPKASNRVDVRVRLDGGDDIPERPKVAFYVVEPGKTTQLDIGDDGSISFDPKYVDRARRFVVTAADADPNDKDRAFMVRPETMRRAVEAGELTVPPSGWARFILVRRCVDATIRRCFPWRFVIDDLLDRVVQLRAASTSIATLARPDLAQLLHPGFGCAPICSGSVEVWRRQCCCVPPIVLDPPPVIVDGPDDPPIPDPGPLHEFPPIPPVPPGPGPDPAPFDLQDAVLSGGAIDTAKVAALQQARWPGHLCPPVPACFCGPPVKVGDGFVGEGGSIHVCWLTPLTLTPVNCHDEYAFIVRQNIAGTTVTIYDGVAAGQWFESGDDIHLTSFHPQAIGCREDDFPVPGAEPFVVLQDIGSTPSYRLTTPLPASADSVVTPGTGSGLLDLDAGADWACGGDLALRYHFSEIAGLSMQALGAVYYRVQWAPATTAGNPAGTWETVPVPAWNTWRVVGTDIVPGSHALGPNAAGGETDLFYIPFETGAPLVGMEEWQDGQFHAFVPTAAKAQGLYLIRIEVFDSAGNRLEPGTTAFTYRRWDTATTTVPVTFGALTHLIHTDNRA